MHEGQATGAAATRRLLVTVLVAGCVGGLLLCLATPADAHRPRGYQHCRGGVETDGTFSRHGFFRHIHARRVSCRTARAAVRKFVLARPERTGPSPRRSEVFTGATFVTSWLCRARLRRGEDNPYESILCSAHGGRRIRFRGAP